jgi:hypothetical protein
MVLENVRTPSRIEAMPMSESTGTGAIQFSLACASALVLAASVPSFAGDYEQGLNLNQNQNFSQSLAQFRRAAEQGDARAQFSLAYMYSEGQGVAQDSLEAHKWAVRAEANGHRHAANLRAQLEKYMSPEQLAQARARASQPPEEPAPALTPTPPQVPVPAPAAADPPAVSLLLEAWRSAWSRRDADAYLAAYAPDFKLPAGVARARWEAQRRQRLARAARIEVRIENPSVSLAPGGSAIVRFKQSYESDRFRESVEKTLVLGIYDGSWLIREESSAP